jgi:hypothetical protein
MFLTPWHVIKTDFSLVELAIANLSIRHCARQYKGEDRSELSSVEDRNRSQFKIPTVQVKRKHGGFRGLRELRSRMGRNLKSGHNQEIALAKRLSIPTQLDRERPQIVGFARDLRQQSVFISISRLRA